MGPFLGLVGCAYELADWTGSDDDTVTAPSTRDRDTEDSATPGPSSMNGTESGGNSTDTDTSVPTCDNDQLDEGETAIDCGGDECQPCGFGLPCLKNEDCKSGVCNETCLAMGCQNDEQDGNETDRDCGGDCEPCPDEAQCRTNSDCRSGVCDDETCQVPTCDDGVKNGDEADKDCGTVACGLCPNGARCEADTQCEQGACKDSVCADPQCNDSRRNGTESDTDCGGSCPPCQADGVCLTDDDCVSQVCLQTSSTTRRCAEATCEDGQQNGAESDTDCGGGMGCSLCADGAKCDRASDCESSVCDAETSICSAPGCDDEVRNGDERGIDCGGGCQGCPDGTPCGSDSDCLSVSCDQQQCVAPTCSDQRQNQDESDVDCGGTCGGCGYGLDCRSDTDCRSNDCDGVCQPGTVGAVCSGGEDCLSGACVGDVCTSGYRGAACLSSDDCRSAYCKSDNTCGSGALGAACQQATDCASNLCTGSVCAASRFVVRSDNGTALAEVNHRAQVQAHASDPPRAWRDLALVYFFSVIAPETRVNYRSRSYQGPDWDVKDNRFLAFNPQGTDWMLVWRALSTNTIAVPSGSTTQIEVHLVDSDWSNFNFANDYSYRSGGFADNNRIVVCQRVDGRWVHTQGVPPAAIANPCALVVDRCEDSTVTCDLLERVD